MYCLPVWRALSQNVRQMKRNALRLYTITYLPNSNDVFTLPQVLGHSDMEMVRRYAQIVQSDCANDHYKACPVNNWRLLFSRNNPAVRSKDDRVAGLVTLGDRC